LEAQRRGKPTRPTFPFKNQLYRSNKPFPSCTNALVPASAMHWFSVHILRIAEGIKRGARRYLQNNHYVRRKNERRRRRQAKKKQLPIMQRPQRTMSGHGWQFRAGRVRSQARRPAEADAASFESCFKADWKISNRLREPELRLPA